MIGHKIFFIQLLVFYFLDTHAQSMYTHPFRYDIPEGFSLLDSASFDYNADGYRDYIIILKNKHEEDNPDTTRLLLIVQGLSTGEYKEVARNEQVVFCKNCGGVFGDPYQGISTKGSFFSIDHYGGSGWRWTRNITFRYVKKTGKFVLHKDGGISYHNSDPDKTTRYFYQRKNYGRLDFSEYTNQLNE